LSRLPEFEGHYYKIECLEFSDGSCPAGDFLDELEKPDRRKLDTLFERLATTGRIDNREKFKKLEGSDQIWEFKSFQIRIPCFFTRDKRVILLFGLVKKKNKYQKSEVERAEQYRSSYLQRPGNAR
jgi:mRNA-degrading endonuclease RelE of RelBE toxin-antitoxin system